MNAAHSPLFSDDSRDAHGIRFEKVQTLRLKRRNTRDHYSKFVHSLFFVELFFGTLFVRVLSIRNNVYR